MNIFRWVAAVGIFFVFAFVGMLWFLEQGSNRFVEPDTPQRIERSPDQAAPGETDTGSTSSNPTLAKTVASNNAQSEKADRVENDTGESVYAQDTATDQAQQDEVVVVESNDAAPLDISDEIASTDATSQPQRASDEKDSRREPPPEGDETLGGRVLNSQGEIMSGATVTAGYRDPVSRRVNPRKRSARVDDRGRYQFSGLAPGEYQLSHLPLPGYSNRTLYVRAGSASADLVLTAVSRIVVSGRVTNTDGLPIPNATVVVSGSKTINTNAEGEYVAEASIQSNSAVAVRVEAPGYGEETLLINGREMMGQSEKTLDVTLQPLGDLSVSGVLRAESGEPVVNELVRIFSPRLKLSARAYTDSDGRFVLSNLQEGDDFRLSIIPKNLYERLERGPVRVIPGMAPLELTLRTHSRGQVTGSIQTVGGNPLPGFSMSLTSSKSPATALVVRADETGRFAIADVPAGNLHFSTPSQPHMDVRGVTLDSGDQVDVNVVVDLGPYRLSGTVTTVDGAPVPGANVVMTWRYQANGLSASSYRQTSTDAAGAYQFSEIAAGAHSIAVNHVSFGQVQNSIDIGPGIDRLNVVLPGR